MALLIQILDLFFRDSVSTALLSYVNIAYTNVIKYDLYAMATFSISSGYRKRRYFRFASNETDPIRR
jgi:hypothetical protein